MYGKANLGLVVNMLMQIYTVGIRRTCTVFQGQQIYILLLLINYCVLELVVSVLQCVPTPKNALLSSPFRNRALMVHHKLPEENATHFRRQRAS